MPTQPRHRVPHATRRLTAVFAALLSLLLVSGGLAAVTAAQAETPGLTISSTTDDGELIAEGSAVGLNVQYSLSGANAVAPGTEITIDLSDNLTVDPATLTFPQNGAIVAVTQNGPTSIVVRFADPLPAGTTQGVFGFSATVNTVASSGTQTLSWTENGTTDGIDVVVLKRGDAVANVKAGTSKSVGSHSLNGTVSVVDGTVRVSDAAIGRVVPFTVRVDSATARTGFAVSDTVDAPLSVVPGSFVATLTTWDADGLNRSTAPFDVNPTVSGATFTATLDLPAQSQLAVTYDTRISTAADRDALQALLQSRYDALGVGGGTFAVDLKNTAKLGSETKIASARVEGTRTGLGSVNHGAAFTKRVDWTVQAVDANADGTLVTPLPISYSLTADLSYFDGRNANFTLTRNVVIDDLLPSALRWASADPVLVSPAGSLTQITYTGAIADFAADQYVGTFAIVGNRVLANVGQDRTTKTTLTLNAEVTTSAGLPTTTTPLLDAQAFTIRNTGNFSFGINGKRDNWGSSVNSKLITTDTKQGYNYPNAFTKQVAAGTSLTATPGEALTIPYTLTLKGTDVTTATIADSLNETLFDVSDAAIADLIADTSATYNGTALPAGSLAVAVDADHTVTISLTPAGIAAVGANHTLTLVITLPVRTLPFDGKESVALTNRATVFGEDDSAMYWSESTAEATSYGDEAETRKFVRNSDTSSWATALTVPLDGDAELSSDVVVYDLVFVPHGAYNHVTIVPEHDVLPAGTEFLGFVSEADVDEPTAPAEGPIALDANLEASYDGATGTITIANQPDTRLDATGPIHAYVAVRIADFTPLTPIVNSFGNASATVTPGSAPSYELDIAKVDAADPDIVIHDPNARFTITDAAGTVVADDVFVDHGKLRVTQGTGTGPVVVHHTGTFTVTEKTAPAGYLVATKPTTVTVDEDGVAAPVTLTNAPKTYALGDTVWVDADRDGVQNESEVLEGTTVILSDADGTEIARTTTDSDGHYLFDELRAGDYRIRFVLTEAQAARYEFTTAGAGDSAARDSNAAQDGTTGLIRLNDANSALTTDYPVAKVAATQGIDPTWDAGVVLKTVPTVAPTTDPTTSPEPTGSPTDTPSIDPTATPTPTAPTEPTEPTDTPTGDPSTGPTTGPTGDGDLASTGGSGSGMLTLAALLLAVGALIAAGAGMRRRTRR